MRVRRLCVRYCLFRLALHCWVPPRVCEWPAGHALPAIAQLLAACRYFDMLRDVGSNGKASTVFVPHQPGGITEIGSQIRSGFLEAQAGKMHAT